MNIIIPLGGIGERFKIDGYTKPKPLIKIFGKEMIFYLIDNLKTKSDDRIYIIYHYDLDKHNFKEKIQNRYKDVILIRLNKVTQGAAETLLYGLNNIDLNNISKKTVVLDCDTFYLHDVLKFRDMTQNIVYCFRDDQNKPIYSYVEFKDKNIIKNIKEKQKISEYANTGCYCFNNGLTLAEYCNKIINENIRENDEYYTSCVIAKMLEDGHTFRAEIIDRDDFQCVGTPLQLKIFCNNFKGYDKMRICFDLDNTLVTYPRTQNDYTTVDPIEKNIKYLRYLKKLGHTIIIYTARRMKTHGGNIGKITKDIGKITFDTLEKYSIPYDEIYFGKPYADVYIDDLALDAYCDLEKEMGIYETNVMERDFNQIVYETIEITTKKSTHDKIKGEIYYYENIPKTLKKYFPIFYGSNELLNQYSIEKIKGITLSYLYVNESLTCDVFNKYLNVIHELHQYPKHVNSQIDIYSNYNDKLVSRYSGYNYKQYAESDKFFTQLSEYFCAYKKNEEGLCGLIHGDPVLSNCLLDENGNFKLIDMRGQLGNELSMYGDIYYDLGKIYQSIIGYDEIMMCKYVSQNYKNMMIETFTQFVEKHYEKNSMTKIKMVCNMLLFTLLPLHDNEKCADYYKLIKIN